MEFRCLLVLLTVGKMVFAKSSHVAHRMSDPKSLPAAEKKILAASKFLGDGHVAPAFGSHNADKIPSLGMHVHINQLAYRSLATK
jgi:hypothetical protein